MIWEKLRHKLGHKKPGFANTHGLLGNVKDVDGKRTGGTATPVSPCDSEQTADRSPDCRDAELIGRAEFRHRNGHRLTVARGTVRPFVVGRIAHGVYVAKVYPRPRGAR